jgi:cytochrome c551/c552
MRLVILAQGVAAGFFVATAVWLAPAAAQHEQQASKTLLPGKGAELTMAKCAICHDITHVTRTRLSRAEWEDNVKVMIARGTPLTPDEAATVVEYLATYYNRDTPPPAAAPDAAVGGDPVMKLLSANACVACHGVEQKIVGPSFAEVAARYAGDAGAADRLAAKIKAGGAGAWGPVPMPPHPALSDSDVKAIVGWILTRK